MQTAQFHQSRQEAGERLTAAGWRDQKDRAAGLCLGKEFELMRAGRPTAARKPAGEEVGKKAGALENSHAPEPDGACASPDFWATTTRPSTGRPFSLRTEVFERRGTENPAAPSKARRWGSA